MSMRNESSRASRLARTLGLEILVLGATCGCGAAPAMDHEEADGRTTETATVAEPLVGALYGQFRFVQPLAKQTQGTVLSVDPTSFMNVRAGTFGRAPTVVRTGTGTYTAVGARPKMPAR